MSHPDRRAILAGAGALVATSAVAETAPAPASTQRATAGPPRVVLQTGDGAITVELAADKAPVTCANFLRYVDAKRYDGGAFYRALKLAPDPLTGLIQGGIKNDPAKSYPPIAHESTKVTGLSHKDGTISMARYDPGTATSEFFIIVGDIPSLDAEAKEGGDPGFAAFGHVVDGMDIARKILTSHDSPTAGEGEMKGQMLDPEIAIVTARRG
jgi:peptidyl-prolyl cis-trans isomerase A (cyclophilin A)